MKFIYLNFFQKKIPFLFIFTLVISANIIYTFQETKTNKIKNTESTNNENDKKDIIDLNFLKTYKNLKKQMLKKGSKFGEFAVKFISKNNRYIIAKENIKVKIKKLN
jgi:hypothetical protein